MDALVTAIVGLASGLTAAITTIRVLASRDHRRADDVPHEITKQMDDLKMQLKEEYHSLANVIEEIKKELKNIQLPFWEKAAEIRHMVDRVSRDTEAIRTRVHDLANSMHEMNIRAEKLDLERGKV